MSKCRRDSGDTQLLPGEMIDSAMFEANLEAIQSGGKPRGKTDPSRYHQSGSRTDSFLSAASSRNCPRPHQAAIKNKIDPLIGLKENVIIGKLIPAGTGEGYNNLSRRKE
ncbi:MAG: hypothetical protein ACLUSP_09655 [Christensenellales bacterium]